MHKDLNVFGEPLISCSTDPMTGYFRDSFCGCNNQEGVLHLVCVVMTDEFLAFSKMRGNDLSTAIPQFHFPGLKAGDRWCLNAIRFMEAYQMGMTPRVVLEATNEKILELIPLKELVKFAAVE